MAVRRPIVSVNGRRSQLPAGDTLPPGDWSAETVSQAEAEAGGSDERRAWTAVRVRQAIAAWWNSITTSFGRAFVASANAAEGRARLSVREVLTADRTYYVRADGSDSNSGLSNTAGGAFLTVQKAVDVAASIDSSVYQTTIKIADGTFSGLIVVGALVGAKPLAITGNDSSPASVVLTGAGNILTVNDASARVVLSGMRFSGGAVHLLASPAGQIEYQNVVFGATSSRHISAQLNGYVGAIGDYAIDGGAQSHITVLQGGKVRLGRGGATTTITLTGTPNFSSAFVRAGEGPSALVCAVSTGQPVFVGGATGSRYSVSTNAVINTNAAGSTYLPGNADGTELTGGRYV